MVKVQIESQFWLIFYESGWSAVFQTVIHPCCFLVDLKDVQGDVFNLYNLSLVQ